MLQNEIKNRLIALQGGFCVQAKSHGKTGVLEGT